jgi:hypothetical protein
MKKLLIFLLAGFLVGNISAQNTSNPQIEKKPDFYLGIGTGLESFSGVIGMTGDFRLQDNYFVRLGAGIGSWGAKFSAGIRAEKKAGNSIGYGVYISWATGLKNFSTQLETTTGNKDVKLDLLPGYTLNPTFSYKWLIRKSHKFYIEAGYAVPLQKNVWRVLDNSQLTDSSRKVMEILQPGGLSIGFGFQFAL